jgi:hypothetical protein
MDINLFARCIKELILVNDKVYVPGMGCFLAELMPASFSDKGTTINPPYRRLFFRVNQKDDEELLFNKLATEVRLSVKQVQIELQEFVEKLCAELNKKKSIVLPELGILRATAQTDYFFVANDDLDIYSDGFGLEPISIKVSKKQESAVEADDSDEEKEAEVEVASEVISEVQVLVEEVKAVDVEVPVEEVKTAAPVRRAWQDDDYYSSSMEESNKGDVSIMKSVIIAIIISIILFFVVIYVFRDDLAPFSEKVISGIDNILNDILYTDEELKLLGK